MGYARIHLDTVTVRSVGQDLECDAIRHSGLSSLDERPDLGVHARVVSC